MRQFLIIILLACCGSPALAYEPTQLTNYYKYIYKAERNIMDKDYKHAAANYDKAFTFGVIPFGVDVYNNALVGMRLADNKRVLEMAKKLVLKGADSSYFRRAIFNSFRKSKEWDALLRAYPALVKQRNKMIDRKLVQKLKDIDDADQRMAIATYHQDTLPSEGTVTKYMKSEDSLCKTLKYLMEHNDYLSEEKTGLEYEDTTLYLQPFWYVLVHHSFQSRHDSSLLFEPLKVAMHAGKIRAELAMAQLVMTNKYTFSNIYFVHHDSLLKENYDRSGLDVLNLLSTKPTKMERDFISTYYIDDPKNIQDKIVGNFHSRCRLIHKTAPEPDDYFVLGLSLNISDSRLISSNEEVIDVCGK